MSQAQETISYTQTHTLTKLQFIPSSLIYTLQITSSERNWRLKLELALKQEEISIWKYERVVLISDLRQMPRSVATTSLHLCHLVPGYIQVSTSAFWLQLKKRKTANCLSWGEEYLTSDKRLWLLVLTSAGVTQRKIFWPHFKFISCFKV